MDNDKQQPSGSTSKRKKKNRRRRNKKDEILDFRKKAPSSTITNSRKAKKGKMSLTTSSQDYGGSLALPDKVSQREYESTGQFFRRLDRMVAKAKVEASLEARFDMNLKPSSDADQQNNSKQSDAPPTKKK